MSMINVQENITANRTKLQEDLAVKNPNALPKLTKITLNVGIGKFRGNKDILAESERRLTVIAGQKPVITLAKRAIAGFKVRTGDQVGLKVTLRGRKMYDFLNRLVNVTFPRMRDFRGLRPENIDAQGNVTIGFKDQNAFAELAQEISDGTFGVTVTLTINQSSPEKTVKLLSALGFPIKID